jgi:hypothetical protein
MRVGSTSPAYIPRRYQFTKFTSCRNHIYNMHHTETCDCSRGYSLWLMTHPVLTSSLS